MEIFSKKILEEKISALSDEIRHYPTPIARCDEQLTALIDERSRLLKLLEQDPKPAGGCTPDAVWANDGGPAF
jgi:hypothetical protein